MARTSSTWRRRPRSKVWLTEWYSTVPRRSRRSASAVLPAPDGAATLRISVGLKRPSRMMPAPVVRVDTPVPCPVMVIR